MADHKPHQPTTPKPQTPAQPGTTTTTTTPAPQQPQPSTQPKPKDGKDDGKPDDATDDEGGERQRARAAPKVAPPKPHTTADGRLTYAGMAAKINAGESVLHNGAIISRLADLPDEADLARGNEELERQMVADIDNQMGELMRQKAKLTQGREKQEAGK